jgi:hypothetical protein
MLVARRNGGGPLWQERGSSPTEGGRVGRVKLSLTVGLLPRQAD